jgi:hypothetical protein
MRSKSSQSAAMMTYRGFFCFPQRLPIADKGQQWHIKGE